MDDTVDDSEDSEDDTWKDGCEEAWSEGDAEGVVDMAAEVVALSVGDEAGALSDIEPTETLAKESDLLSNKARADAQDSRCSRG